jgi:hypothetical protein
MDPFNLVSALEGRQTSVALKPIIGRGRGRGRGRGIGYPAGGGSKAGMPVR